MRRTRCSPRFSGSRAARAACAALLVALGTACGGGAAAPAATAAATTVPVGVPAPSPQRPPLASPAPSPSVAAASTGGSAGASGGDSYDIQSGDTLATIAQQYYGDPAQWRRIYDANKDAIGADPDKLKLGTTLKIPPKQP